MENNHSNNTISSLKVGTSTGVDSTFGSLNSYSPVVLPALAGIGVNYILSSSAYKKEFSLYKWMGIPIITGLVVLGSWYGVKALMNRTNK